MSKLASALSAVLLSSCAPTPAPNLAPAPAPIAAPPVPSELAAFVDVVHPYPCGVPRLTPGDPIRFYPQRAMEREVEGWVIARITVSPDGSVMNFEVLGAGPTGWLFEDAARATSAAMSFPPRAAECSYVGKTSFLLR